MKKIRLTRGYHALVDDEDYEWLSKWKWHATVRANYVRSARAERVDGKWTLLYMHRAILGLKHGDTLQVDHINHNPLDNRRSNIRICTAAENCHNRRIRKGRSCFKGVSWSSKLKKWKVSIVLNYERTHLGYYVSEKDAAIAYNEKANALFGEFALLNKI